MIVQDAIRRKERYAKPEEPKEDTDICLQIEQYYGKIPGEIEIMRKIELSSEKLLGPCMDVCAYNGYFYVIQNRDQYEGGRLCKVDTCGNIISEYVGIGCARQIEIKNGIAAISSREDGLWLFDIDASCIKLLSHYQTIEYATGITLWSNFVFVSCRQYGVEVIDITDAANPRFVSIIRIGEVQSTCVCDEVLYCGVWGAMNVTVVDIHDISHPIIVTRLPLEGRGDGLFVENGILYAAIGQHRRGIKNISDKNDPCFGNGNGFEVFNVNDIYDIKHIKTVFTDKKYISSFDTWCTYVFENYVAVANSWLGCYFYDKKTLEPAAHIYSKTSPYYDRILDSSVDNDPVVGMAQIENKLAIATGRGGLSIIDNVFGNMCKSSDGKNVSVNKEDFYSNSDKLTAFFSTDGLVSDVCDIDGNLLISSGVCGFYVVDLHGKIIASHKTKGFCQNAKYKNGYIYSAESDNGISVYSYRQGIVEETANIKFGMPALQLVLDSTGKYILACFGSTCLKVYDISNRDNPIEVCSRNAKFGPIYGENFALNFASDGSNVMFWHRDGLILFNAKKEPKISEHVVLKKNGFMGFGPETGIDCYGGKIFYNLDGGLLELSVGDNLYADDMIYHKGNGFVSGKFVIHNNFVISCERAKGVVTVTDISDISYPNELYKINTNASTGRPAIINNNVYIPGGHAGLLILRQHRITASQKESD